MNVKEAAKHAGVSPALVYLWCAERRLPHMRLGARGRRGKIQIRQTDLDAFLETCKVTEPPADGEEAVPEPAASGPKLKGVDLW